MKFPKQMSLSPNEKSSKWKFTPNDANVFLFLKQNSQPEAKNSKSCFPPPQEENICNLAKCPQKSKMFLIYFKLIKLFLFLTVTLGKVHKDPGSTHSNVHKLGTVANNSVQVKFLQISQQFPTKSPI